MGFVYIIVAILQYIFYTNVAIDLICTSHNLFLLTYINNFLSC